MTVSHNDNRAGRPQEKAITKDVFTGWLPGVIKQRPHSAEDGAQKCSVLELWKTHGLTNRLSDYSKFRKLKLLGTVSDIGFWISFAKKRAGSKSCPSQLS